MTLDVMNRAVTDSCALNFQTSDASPTKAIAVGPSWPGLDYSAQIYQDNWGNFVSLWANFRVDRASNREPYLLYYQPCISLLERAEIGNGTESHGGMKDCTNTTGNGLLRMEDGELRILELSLRSLSVHLAFIVYRTGRDLEVADFSHWKEKGGKEHGKK
ncbi:hypothetical protein HO133_003126 [Letharia lupina]|uniref:Uncharacterized protein n=1 Tax=Letharia lupina TaxID=560253 RepID=A0A8H6CBV3_9LECA|nr:uncharacterized protein HO133_003126 [Letharia lupina]KAF6220693.1 hypothetical protein HO133_003126 [Letharia lupina]